MKRILILCAALALLAAAGVSSLQEAEDPGALLALVNPQDTSVIVRRVHEGPDLDFWGTCPSPDGRYVTQTDWDTGDLAVLDLLTGQKRRVSGKGDDGWANSFAYSEAACFSPDGQRIAYSWYTEPGLYELRIINADGTNSHLVARPGFDPTDPPPSYIDEFEWYPDLHGWSPDGEHILATLYRGREEGEVTLISVADGSKEVLYLSEGPQFAALSPDGRQLAFGDGEDVFVKPVSGGSPERVASGPSKDLLVGWTEDGNLLYFSDRDLTEGVWRVPMRDGRPAGDAALVAGDLWGMKPMGVAGNSLFYGIQTQAPRLHVVPLDLTRNRLSGTPTPVEPQMRASSFPAWSPDGLKLMYLVGADTPERRLMLRSTAGGETRDVTPGSLTPGRDLIRWSEDGRKVLISGEERESGRSGFFAYTLATGEVEYVFSPDEIAGMDVGWEMFSRDWGTVYLAVRERDDGPAEVMRRDLATKDQRTLLARPGRLDGGQPIRRMFPSPDDRYLAFWELAEPDTARMLRVIFTAGGEPRTLLTVPSSDEAAGYPDCFDSYIVSWTSDGRHLLSFLRDSVPEGEPFSPNLCELYKVPVDGGDPIFVGAIPKPSLPWALSPDDNRLAFSLGEYRGEIWIMEGLDRR